MVSPVCSGGPRSGFGSLGSSSVPLLGTSLVRTAVCGQWCHLLWRPGRRRPHPAPLGAAGRVGWEAACDTMLNGLGPLTSPEATAAFPERLAALGHPAALSRHPRESTWLRGRPALGAASRPVPRPASLRRSLSRRRARCWATWYTTGLPGRPCHSPGRESTRVGVWGGQAQRDPGRGEARCGLGCPPRLQDRELEMSGGRAPQPAGPPLRAACASGRGPLSAALLCLQFGCPAPGSPSSGVPLPSALRLHAAASLPGKPRGAGCLPRCELGA